MSLTRFEFFPISGSDLPLTWAQITAGQLTRCPVQASKYLSLLNCWPCRGKYQSTAV
jgi:hypothetical protein